MNHELHSEVVTPPHRLVVPLTIAAVGVGLLGAALVALDSSAVEPAEVPLPGPGTAETIALTVPVPMIVSRPAPRSAEVALVFAAGGVAYAKLASLDGDDAEAMPRHGRPRQVVGHDDYVETAVADVDDRDVPRALRRWKGRSVVVDGTCRAQVTGFAVVARLTGDPDYAGSEASAWSAQAILEHGAPSLVARLDGCADGMIARDAALSPVIAAEPLDDPDAIAAARRLVISSPEAAAAQREWASMVPGRWHDHEDTQWSDVVVRHPGTGETFVSIHATHDQGCGDPNIRIWQLFRIGRDGGLTRVPTSSDPLLTIDRLVDLDGDGSFEAIGLRWHGPHRMVMRSTGEILGELDVPFYGCSC